MNRFHPFVILLSGLAASSMLLAQSGSTFPVNGTPDAQTELHAYEGARVHLSADEVIENGYVAVRRGRIEAVGQFARAGVAEGGALKQH